MGELATQRTTDIIAAEINSIKEQTRKIMLNNSIEIGRRLAEAKQLVPHGEWGTWLETNVDYSQTTAKNLLKIFEQYGADQLSIFGDNVKSEAFEKLSYTQAVALLGVPEEEREAFIQENDVEKMSTRELQRVIKEKQEVEQRLKEAQKKEQDEREAKEKISLRFTELDRKYKEHSELLDKLKKERDKSYKTGNLEEIKKMQDAVFSSKEEIERYKDEIKKLEEQLKQKPIDVPATVEVVPQEVEKELQELRDKVKQQDNKAITKFTVTFESLVEQFKSLLGSLDEIGKEDPEAQGKYKGAVKGLLSRMGERV